MEKPTENIVECFIRCRGLLSSQMLDEMVNRLSRDHITQSIFYFYHEFYETLEALPTALVIPDLTFGTRSESTPKS